MWDGRYVTGEADIVRDARRLLAAPFSPDSRWEAEARDVIVALVAALDRLEAERDAIKEKFDHLHSEWQYGHDRGDHLIYESEWELFDAWQRGELVDRVEAAEAERDRLRARLSYIASEYECSCETPGTDFDCESCTARAALGGTDG